MKMSKVYKFWIALLSIIGGGSLLYGLIVLLTMGWQPSYLYFWAGLFGVCLVLIIGIFLTTRDGKMPPKWLVIPVEIVVLAFCMVFIIVEAFIIHGSSGKTIENSDYLIVLGAKVNGNQPSLTLRQRIEAAADYLLRNPNTIAIASGGKGTDEDISEAQCIYEQLVLRGVAPERIILEDRSTSTKENMTFSAELILQDEQKRLANDENAVTSGAEQNVVQEIESIDTPETGIHCSVVITTTEFHIYRALHLANDTGFYNVSGNPAQSAWWLIPTNYTREFMAVMKDVILKK